MLKIKIASISMLSASLIYYSTSICHCTI